MSGLATDTLIKAAKAKTKEKPRKRKTSEMKPLSRRIGYTIMTVLSFMPGMSWIPSYSVLTKQVDSSYAQTLLTRKLFEMFGESAPQFILQVAIEIHNHTLTSKGLNNIEMSNFLSSIHYAATIGFASQYQVQNKWSL